VFTYICMVRASACLHECVHSGRGIIQPACCRLLAFTGWDYVLFCTHINAMGTPERNWYQWGMQRPGDGCYATNDITVGRRSFCLHTFGIFCKDKMSSIQSKCMYFYISLYSQTPLPSLFEIKFYIKNMKFYNVNNY